MRSGNIFASKRFLITRCTIAVIAPLVAGRAPRSSGPGRMNGLGGGPGSIKSNAGFTHSFPRKRDMGVRAQSHDSTTGLVLELGASGAVVAHSHTPRMAVL